MLCQTTLINIVQANLKIFLSNTPSTMYPHHWPAIHSTYNKGPRKIFISVQRYWCLLIDTTPDGPSLRVITCAGMWYVIVVFLLHSAEFAPNKSYMEDLSVGWPCKGVSPWWRSKLIYLCAKNHHWEKSFRLKTMYLCMFLLTAPIKSRGTRQLTASLL
jgi:hypothetical protein